MEDDVPIDDLSENEERDTKRCRLRKRQEVQCKKICAKEERNASIKKVSVILQKSEGDRSFEESRLLLECSSAVEEVQSRWRKRDELKRRLEEFEDPLEELKQKCQLLAQAIAQSQHLVVYTGAGISTAAKIPDYRGPNGIWTRLQQGKEIGDHDLSLAEPTYTHMALSELYQRNILKYVVSQNCDGLHSRSGLPKTALSELHGNMYIEVCKNCKPHIEYWRLFDVTENTARYAHKTMRKCYFCNEPLVDTIVHFGERGSLQWPLNWAGACKNAEKATTILCLGSSLKVLKKYPWLWQMDKPAKRRPNLYIVNLQWTPKDDFANVKIHGKCDAVMKIVMDMLDIEVSGYSKYNDPIYAHASHLADVELHTTTQPILKLECKIKSELLSVKKECDDSFNSYDGNAVIKEESDSLNNKKDCLSSYNSDLNKSQIGNIHENKVCDNTSNRSNNKTVQSIQQCLPTQKQNNKIVSPTNTVFTIDSILHHKSSVQEYNLANAAVPQNNYLITPNYSLLGYDFNTNIYSNQILGAYSDFIWYPYQTSFLYPGLHSIINPIPFIKNEIVEELPTQPLEASCDFCQDKYKSMVCLFYRSVEPVFVNQQYRYSKIQEKKKPNSCVCCDYTTEEEDLEEIDKDCTGYNDKEQDKNGKIQAGWFGKGYKKYRRFKKR